MTGVDDQIRFLDEIGVHGLRSVSAAAARARLREMKAAGRFDTIPSEVWGRVRRRLTERSMTRSRLQLAVGTRSSGDLNGDICPSRSRLRRIAEVLGDAQLEMMATNDIFWDKIRERRTARTPARLRRDGQGNPQFRSKWNKSTQQVSNKILTS